MLLFFSNDSFILLHEVGGCSEEDAQCLHRSAVFLCKGSTAYP